MNETRSQRIATVLGGRFAPVRIEVTDRSASHAGHAGSSDAGETHYDVLVVSAAFAGLSRVARSRTPPPSPRAPSASGLHALSLTLRTPEEETAAVAAGRQSVVGAPRQSFIG